jgi:lipopolysaccharide/colanic/teichoic acid biosynthesis glycosyltransferase
MRPEYLSFSHPQFGDEEIAETLDHGSAPSVPRQPSAVCGTVQEAASSSPRRAAGSALHRAFDAACSLSGLILLVPVFVLIALAIKLDDGGPIFYRQFRVGKNLRPFRLWKFRSMVANAEIGSQLTAQGDTRVTRIGCFLRKNKLDELPQLVNVLRGEMALVGVRPQVPQFVEPYRSEYEELLQVPPGITDPASLRFRNEAEVFGGGSIEEQYVKRILPEKLKISIEYQRSRTFLSDLQVLLRTVLRLEPPAVRPGPEESALSLGPLPKGFSRNS